MTNLARGLDHVIVAVPDLGRARLACERMGFVVTDRASHPRFGTANHLLIFENAYVELLAIVDRNPADASSQATLKTRGFGLHTFALATDDIEAEYHRLSALEPRLSRPVTWTRTVTDGEPGELAKFSTMWLPETLSPVAPMFYCQQHTRENVWRPQSLAHPNGARRLSRVTATVAAVSEAAAGKYRSLFPDARLDTREDAICIRFGDQSLELREGDPSKIAAAVVLERDGAAAANLDSNEARVLELPDSSAVMLVLEKVS